MRLSSSDLRRLMRQIGLSAQEIIEAEEVVIRLKGREIVITSPQVIKLTIQSETLYQIVGGTEKVSDQPPAKTEELQTISEEDVNFVSEQAHVPPEVARAALVETKGDVAKALMRLRRG